MSDKHGETRCKMRSQKLTHTRSAGAGLRNVVECSDRVRVKAGKLGKVVHDDFHRRCRGSGNRCGRSGASEGGDDESRKELHFRVCE